MARKIQLRDGHTPGPWATMIDSTQEYIAVYAKVGQGTKVICPVKIGDQANAALIAAAPELLDALKIAAKAIRIWHGFGHTVDEAELWTLYQQSPEMQLITGAIAKAEGGP